MTTYFPAKKNAEMIFYIPLVSQSTGQFQVNPTIASGDFKVSTDGGALANLTTLPAVTPVGSRSVKFTISAAEMNGDNIVIQGVDAAGSEWDEVYIHIHTTARQIDDLAYPTTSGRSIDVSATGEVEANMTHIDGQATSGNNATLKLKQLDIRNDIDYPVYISTSQNGGVAVGINSDGAAGTGIDIYGQDIGLGIGSNINALNLISNTGKSINAPNDIAVSDGNLTLSAIANAVWINATRTLTAISDSAGITTLLSRIGSALNISSGKVEANIKQINGTNVTGDGSGTPWGPV